MKLSYILPLLALSGCVSIELPGVVSDTAKLTKDTYNSVVGKKTDPKTAASSAAPTQNMLVHSYIGKPNQTIAEIKQFCVNEAALKLIQLTGKELPYNVVENDIVTINNNVVANCKLATSI